MAPLALILTGLLTGWGLLVAIGTQTAFVLRQGLRGDHVRPVVAFCTVSDVVMIACSVFGVGLALSRWPVLLPIMRWLGGLFVMGYGTHAAYRALRPSVLFEPARGIAPSRRHTLAVLAGLTWLNPHLYLDMMLMGTMANSQGSLGRWWFFAGLVLASASWFVALGYGARLLRPLFARPTSWRILDSLIAVVMVTLGITLILRG